MILFDIYTVFSDYWDIYSFFDETYKFLRNLKFHSKLIKCGWKILKILKSH